MPFTFSHPAAILPFNLIRKPWISLTGLIAGSVVPDFEYFIRMRDNSIYSHTWAGLFWFDLPLGLVLTFVYHYMVRNAFIDHTPGLLKRRLWRYRNINWNASFSRRWAFVLLSVLIGSVCHLLWDMFTHTTVHLATKVPTINDKLHIKENHRLSYMLFWDFSSLVGGIFIIFSLWQLPVFKGTMPRNNKWLYWFCVLAAAGISFGIWFALCEDRSFPNCTVAGISSFLQALAVVSFIFKLVQEKKTVREVYHQVATK